MSSILPFPARAEQSAKRLSTRELEVAERLTSANKVIAFELGLSEHTVRAHVAAIFRKSGLNNRASVVQMIERAERKAA